MSARIPHYRTVIGFCMVAIAGYALLSVWAVLFARDATLLGDIVGTWKSFAVAAFGFWVGASSGGKLQSQDATGKPDDPVNVAAVEPVT